MPSSYTTSLRFELQFTGENLNLWGDKLNAALSRVDEAVAGFATVALSGPLTLSTANGVADQARLAMLKFTGTGAFTVTLPAVSKRYDIWNACTGALTLTNGSASATVQSGEVVSVVTDGAGAFVRVQPTDLGGRRVTGLGDPTGAQDAATKAYVDSSIATASFTMGTFGVPVSPGVAGKFLTNNGSVPSWAYPTVAAISDYVADQAAKATAATAQAIAFAVAL